MTLKSEFRRSRMKANKSEILKFLPSSVEKRISKPEKVVEIRFQDLARHLAW